ncbi:MAG: hypothetical protein KA275_07035 [Chitinophagaceae bacterium]|nr:hypothetical protein [Chitinophagaceae bacterium]
MKSKIILNPKHLVILASLLFLFACNKDKEDLSTAQDNSKLNSLYSENNLKPIISNFPNNVGISTYGPGGSRLVIQPNTFVDVNGNIISGTINIEFTDYTNRTDMVFSKILPISNGEPLISGGEYNLKASANGAEVFIAPGKTIEVKLPQNAAFNNTGMEFFRGEFIQNIAQESANTVNWFEPETLSVGTIITATDTISIFNDSTGLCNADKFFTSPNYVDFDIEVNGATIKGTTFQGYCFYKGLNAVWSLPINLSNTIEAKQIPDLECHFVVFGYYQGELYAGTITDITPQNNVKLNITLIKTDASTLKNLMKTWL